MSDRDAVRLIREGDVPRLDDGRTFRYSAARAVAAVIVVIAAAVALVVVGRMRGVPPAYFGAAILLLILWMYTGMIRARFTPANWLVRVADDGLFIKFRSYLNHHMPAQDPVVVFVPFLELRRARMVRETRTMPSSGRTGTTWQRRTLVELMLRDDAPELERALAAERNAKAPKEPRWYGSSSMRYRHHPVSMPSPRLIQLAWEVVPGAAELLQMLAAHVDVESIKVETDYSRLAGLDRAEQERRLRELAESGQTLAAIKLARSIYGYDMTEAKRFVDGLVQKPSPGTHRKA